MDRYDNLYVKATDCLSIVVEAYRLDSYDNIGEVVAIFLVQVVEAYRLDRYDNLNKKAWGFPRECCRSLSFG